MKVNVCWLKEQRGLKNGGWWSEKHNVNARVWSSASLFPLNVPLNAWPKIISVWGIDREMDSKMSGWEIVKEGEETKFRYILWVECAGEIG